MNKLTLKIGDIVEDKNGKTVLFETENGVYEKFLSDKKYDSTTQKWIESEESATKVNEVCVKYLKNKYDEIDASIGLDIEVFEHEGKIYFEEFTPIDKVTDNLPKYFKCTISDIQFKSTSIMPIVSYEGYNYKVGGYSFYNYSDGEYSVNFTKKPKAIKKFIEDIGYNCHHDKLIDHLEEVKEMLIGKEITVVRQVTGKNQWLSTEWDFKI